MFYIYILQNSSGRFYIGYTSNLEERIKRHQQGRSPYTKNRGPWKLVYSESYPTKTQAAAREKFIKSKKSSVFIKKLIDQKNQALS